MARGADKDTKRKKVSKDSWKKALRIFSYLKEYRPHFAFGMFLLFASSVTTLIVPRLMGQMAGIGISNESSEWQMNIGGRQLDMMDLNTVAVVLFLIFIVQAIISFLKVYVFSFVTEHMMRDLRKDVFAHMIRLPMSFCSWLIVLIFPRGAQKYTFFHLPQGYFMEYPTSLTMGEYTIRLPLALSRNGQRSRKKYKAKESLQGFMEESLENIQLSEGIPTPFCLWHVPFVCE